MRYPGNKTLLQMGRQPSQYMVKNYQSWVDFALSDEGGGLSVEPVFVNGFTKTAASWMLAAVMNSSTKSMTFGFDAGAGQFVNLGSEVHHTKAVTAPLMQRKWPAMQVEGENVTDSVASDHCVFLNYYRMKRRVFWSWASKAAAGPHNLPSNRDRDDADENSSSRPSSQDGSEVEPDDATSSSKVCDRLFFFTSSAINFLFLHFFKQSYDPVEFVLNYILEVGSKSAYK